MNANQCEVPDYNPPGVEVAEMISKGLLFHELARNIFLSFFRNDHLFRLEDAAADIFIKTSSPPSAVLEKSICPWMN